MRLHSKVTASPFQPGRRHVQRSLHGQGHFDKPRPVWDFWRSQRPTSFRRCSAPGTITLERADIGAPGRPIPISRPGSVRARRKAVDRILIGLEAQYNQFSKMVMEEAQRMIINDLAGRGGCHHAEARGRDPTWRLVEAWLGSVWAAQPPTLAWIPVARSGNSAGCCAHSVPAPGIGRSVVPERRHTAPWRRPPAPTGDNYNRLIDFGRILDLGVGHREVPVAVTGLPLSSGREPLCW